MESALLGLILDSSVIIAAERKRLPIEQLLISVSQKFGDVEIAISAVTLAELVHGVARANTDDIRRNRRLFIDELKKHVPVHPVTENTAGNRRANQWRASVQGHYAACRRSPDRRFRD
jgi:predicted nucleic acid-binding protein